MPTVSQSTSEPQTSAAATPAAERPDRGLRSDQQFRPCHRLARTHPQHVQHRREPAHLISRASREAAEIRSGMFEVRVDRSTCEGVPKNNARRIDPTPAMCPGGNVTNDTSSGSPASSAGMVRYSASTALWVCCTPLGADVVPDVYSSRHTSSESTAGRRYSSTSTSSSRNAR
jgi:hypothetical protein